VTGQQVEIVPPISVEEQNWILHEASVSLSATMICRLQEGLTFDTTKWHREEQCWTDFVPGGIVALDEGSYYKETFYQA